MFKLKNKRENFIFYSVSSKHYFFRDIHLKYVQSLTFSPKNSKIISKEF
jgi:hypothetical protein